uniref:Uncharacterized protein n=1 Tax=Anguilla anguilla TaxID=7936 RepID=A0A0E9XSQ0_ANGAN
MLIFIKWNVFIHLYKNKCVRQVPKIRAMSLRNLRQIVLTGLQIQDGLNTKVCRSTTLILQSLLTFEGKKKLGTLNEFKSCQYIRKEEWCSSKKTI